MLFVVQIAVEQIAVLIQISNRIRRLQRIRNVLFVPPALRSTLEDSVAGGKNTGSCQTDNQSDDQPFDCRLSVSRFSRFPLSPLSQPLLPVPFLHLSGYFPLSAETLCSHIRIYCLSILISYTPYHFQILGISRIDLDFSRIFRTCTIMVSVLTAFSFQIRS